LGSREDDLLEYEELVMATNLLVPYGMLRSEMGKIDIKKNIVNELSTTFWVPKTLITLQLKQLLTSKAQIDQTTRSTQETILIK
jgi:Zn-dependent peptidase ImmA (M78 family)